ncbi:preprotein translocase subunit SecY [Leptospira biflexa]|jgi:preprotein translocase subunit SecY|uniref:Protein translocase subunit SecY n=1 Tax=Leptospira biflexa serovar Patoc (strain Patoc 1 / ATCC 23582 / Paris) TaxID=456481 RepID=B0SSF8_LEPBP|nr:preprotein translocase subunit SecY [Leptospira biflexa]ABZ94397.1 Preprotein translocase, SecY subunit [Leptospira biflexa serovar Patoc strain 'Patoc 1 (Ames)']ABZ98048.1 Preprotein translocase SecY subunit; putative membrane protein [Leptospira biflexa serovar Patoc strain 'Patoc 1 (Paris)']TGM36681.1 preprotein translocase subunit SecY [Leptospira biflexa]TGM39664.1 preprotein translocase subunit SecY [Leptospira biflexa]TGM45179.1 preprotein translocase subunit SecY [Leptospira biflexa
MFQTIANIFRIPELRSKILFTIGMLLLFRMGTHVTIPGINSLIVTGITADPSEGFLGMVDLFAGGALLKFSIFALGIMPYISSSIIMQLVMVLIPSLQKMQKEGEEGRKKIQQYTKYGTLILCAIQSLAVIQLANSWSTGSGNAQAKYPGLINPSVEGYFLPIAMLSITTGTVLLIWLGEQITERGIGNGISLIIFAGIIGRMPEALIAMFTSDTSDALSILILIIIFIVLISLTVILTQGVRRVPLNYGKQMVGRKMVQARSQSIPFKVNSANVMPIIFASSLILFPQTIVQWLSSKGGQWAGWAVIMDYFNPFSQIWYHALFYYVIYTSLIIFFAYFYTAIQFNPQELADNLKKYGGFIPGVRPGSQTKEMIEKILNRITLPGALFLAGLALAPYLIIKFLNLGSNTGGGTLVYTFGGTSLLIMVGVALETLKQIEAQLLMRNYEGFMKKTKIKGRV